MTSSASNPDGTDAPMPEPRTLVVVLVAGGRYCLDVHQVREIVAAPRITRVPGAPGDIAGVINVRGRVLPLTDLGRILGETPTPMTERTTALVLDLDEADAGPAVLAEVADVIELPPDRLDPLPAFGLGAAAVHLSAVARLDDGTLAPLVDLHQLFGPAAVKDAETP